MMKTINRFDEFREILYQKVAHHVNGEVFPYRFEPPDLVETVEQVRHHPKVRVAKGERGDRLSKSMAEYEDDFREMPLEDAIHAPISLSIFQLESLREPGGALADVIESVYLPLAEIWSEQGLKWKRVYPILFLSGPGCSTNYHWDPSSVLIVQLYGHKRYHSLKEPGRWCPEEVLEQGHDAMVKPEELSTEDILTFDLHPGDAVWSPNRQPHWVDAFDETAFTLSIAFTDINASQETEMEMLVE